MDNSSYLKEKPPPTKKQTKAIKMKGFFCQHYTAVYENKNCSCRVLGKELDGKEKRSLMIYIHGGGFCMGSSGDKRDLTFLSELVEQFPSLIIASVDYSLSPKHEFPVQIGDCVRCIKWLLISEEFPLVGLQDQIDFQKIVLCGSGAGGNLAIACLPLLKQQKICDSILGLILVAPWLFVRPLVKSRFEPRNQYFITEPIIRWCETKYLNSDPSLLWSPQVCPLKSENFLHFPQTLLLTSGRDPLQDEHLMFKKKLKQNNVKIRHTHFEKRVFCFHLNGTKKHRKEAINTIIPFLYSIIYVNKKNK
ncbi:ab hydrolase superfamily protein c4a8.06c [Anaeramoeba flamelloides]|uniref:Ab hydrolase superfamily protein c4a8.06c n=1 Tax=Anaeramoeba flamelloides TaxID=1746091 RepID=A0ABQ8YVF2_9EUKA|nr:ab hydrolase superfamily protein c4a8.06c [Anaeramoeba flamelloides]